MVSHLIVFILLSFNQNIIHRDGHERKKLLEEKYGKLIILKPYNDDIGIADNKHQKYVKQLQNI